ncbi:MAG: OB-fold nucleic acid binding domain-containing protein [Candidatus Goldbacteria bacterium]|nr:OB-fold nucleic acid binding domain-containing protein [Candidatus Goldiibacteriota bacterium]
MKDFYKKTITVTIAIVIILFFTKILIIDELKNVKNSGSPQVMQTNTINKDFKTKDKKSINWKDANKYIGEYVETEGEIVSSYNNGRVCFLNFHKDYKGYLTLVIFASDYKKFPEKPEKYYLGKRIKVEGRIKEYQNRPEIILKTPDQILISDKN